MISTENERQVIVIDFGTVRIVQETDPTRNHKEPFTPIRQSLFWLINGKNANMEDTARVREPFAIILETDEEKEAYARGITGMTLLYPNQFAIATLGDGTHIVIGKSVHKKGTPMLVMSEKGDMQVIYHTWQESQDAGTTRIR